MNFRSLFFVVLIATALPVSAAFAADKPERRPSPSLASLPAPAGAGALRILLIDDDWSENNRPLGDKRLSVSDTVFRRLAADAVGGDAKAWAVETVEAYKNGPSVERLNKFNLIVWYTGANYGGGADNAAALSIEDEKTVRRYLEETGGVVMLISPGYAERALGYASTWEKSEWPFLSEVMGVRGGVGMAQRFEAGTVTTSDGKQFNVGKGAPPETQFSLVNPDGAAVLMTSLLKSHYSTGAPMPVAIANSYGRGRIVYVGFTFENLAEADRAPAFQYLLSATGLTSKIELTSPHRQAPVKTADTGPATVQVTGTPTTAVVSWTLPSAKVENAVLTTPEQTTNPVQTTTKKRSSTPLPQAPGQPEPVTVERLFPDGRSVRLALASPDATQATDPGPLRPGRAVTYRVTATDARGTGFKDVTYTPPLPKDPDSLTAAVQADGSVVLSWPEVPGVMRYQISASKGLNAPVIVRNVTEWRGPRLDATSRRWTVNSVYDPGGSLTAATAWPSATTQGTSNAGLPTPRVPFLNLPNGPGSYANSQAHFRTRCSDALLPGSLCTAAGFILTSGANFIDAWQFRTLSLLGSSPPNWPVAEFTDKYDLGVARRVNCTPRRNGATVCWATSHANLDRIDSDLPRSLSMIIMEDDKAYFGNWEWPGGDLPHEEDRGPGWRGAADIELSYAKHSPLSAGSALDSQGRKGVPHACLSCHGGRYDSTSGKVIGASLLPLVMGRIEFGGLDWNGQDSPQVAANRKGWAAESIRRINQIILQSNPASGITEQINAMYNGTPGTPGTVANEGVVPVGWAQQQGLYRQVIGPYCASCHFAQRGPMHFRSWGNLLQNKAAVQRTVCTEFTMPHSEILFKKFWTEGNGVSLPGLLSTALGFPKCR